MPKIFIGSIKKNSSTSKLQEKLGEYGFIQSAEILHPSENVISKGFAIVNISLRNISIEVFMKSKISYEGVNLYLASYLEGEDIKKRNEELSKKKVFVSGIPESYTNEQLLKIFSHFGGIETAYINRKRHIKKNVVVGGGAAGGKKSQEMKFFFGFVTFLEENSASHCLEEGLSHLGYDFEVNRFTPKPLTDFKEKQIKDQSKQKIKQKKLKKKRKKNRKKRIAQQKSQNKNQLEQRQSNQKQQYVRKHTGGRGNQDSAPRSSEVPIYQQKPKRNERRHHVNYYSKYQERVCLRHHPLDELLEVSKNHDYDNLRFNRSRFTNPKLHFKRNSRRANLSSSNSATNHRFTKNFLINTPSNKSYKEPFGHSSPQCSSFTEEMAPAQSRHF